MNPARLALVSVCTCLSLSLSAAAAAAESPDLGWIARIPGVTSHVERSGAPGGAVYTVAGDPGTVLGRIHAGFVKDGWTIEKFRNVDLGGASVRTLVAVKGETRVKLLLNAESGASQILLSTQRVGEPDPETPEGLTDVIRVNPAPQAPSAEATAAAITVGPRHELLVDRAKSTLACLDSEIVVAAHRNEVVLQGRCQKVVVNGNRNKVRVRGSVESITLSGGYNTVTWSAGGSPKAPRVVDLGNHNKVERVE
jgi:hypothetical protein